MASLTCADRLSGAIKQQLICSPLYPTKYGLFNKSGSGWSHIQTEKKYGFQLNMEIKEMNKLPQRRSEVYLLPPASTLVWVLPLWHWGEPLGPVFALAELQSSLLEACCPDSPAHLQTTAHERHFHQNKHELWALLRFGCEVLRIFNRALAMKKSPVNLQMQSFRFNCGRFLILFQNGYVFLVHLLVPSVLISISVSCGDKCVWTKGVLTHTQLFFQLAVPLGKKKNC